jgi:hypothetical protein
MGEWRQAGTAAQQYPRVSAQVPVRVSTVDPEPDPISGNLFYRSVEATTANLSRGGAFVYSWEPLAAGRRVVIEIDLPDEDAGPRSRAGTKTLQLIGQVVWTRRQLQPIRADGQDAQPGYGLEFTGDAKPELERLDRYLQSIEPDRATAGPPSAAAGSGRSGTTTPSQPYDP